MKKSARILLFAMGAVLLAADVQSGPLPPFTASYDIHHGNSKVGESDKSLTYPSGNSYVYTSVERISVSLYRQEIEEKSEGEIAAIGYQPTEYSMVTDKKPTFDKKDFSSGLQDNLSQSLMLSYFLFNQEVPRTVELVTASGPQTYAFTVIQSDGQLDTALGTLDVVQVRFQDDKGNQVDEWLAKLYEYLPVQYQISKGGKTTGMIYVTRASSGMGLE